MNNCLKLSPVVEPKPLQINYGGQITDFDQVRNCWIIDFHFSARCAVNLLVNPYVGDKVCFVEMDNEYYITQLLSRDISSDTLTLQSDKKVHWLAPEFKLTAFENLELVSLNKIAVTSKNYVMSAANTMIQQAENLIQHVGQFSLTAKGLLRLNGKQQIITAEKDVRIDGERINMG
jgi:hypothetical protein